MWIRTAVGCLPALVVAGALVVPAQSQEPIGYRTDCKALATAKLTAAATVATPSGIAGDFDSASFDNGFEIIDPFWLESSDGRGVQAAAQLSFFQCCQTDAGADVYGTSTYKFGGDTGSMSFSANSGRVHKNWIERGPLGVCPGDPVNTRSTYEIPQPEMLQVQVPFKVSGANVWRFMAAIGAGRSDTGSTTGFVDGTWQIWQDTNCDCTIDRGDILEVEEHVYVKPNESFGYCTLFELKPACYIGRYLYFVNSELAVDSQSCRESIAKDSQVDDWFETYFVVY